jgi:anti-sigma factor RsiW
MKCHEAQRELALHAGEDLGDAQREAEIKQHLAECPTCRRKHAGVKTALAALAAPSTPGTFESVHSLWPAVRRRIAQGDHTTSAGWSWQTVGPTVAGLVVCAGLMVSTAVLLQRPVVRDEPVSTPPTVPIYPSQYEAHVPAHSNTARAALMNRDEDKTVRGALSRRLALPEE